MNVTSDGLYRLGTRQGKLKPLYARSQFTVCKISLLPLEDIPCYKEITLRSASSQQTTGTGQCFVKCMCSTKCQTMRCLCLRK